MAAIVAIFQQKARGLGDSRHGKSLPVFRFAGERER
jgi:hypothetical protein